MNPCYNQVDVGRDYAHYGLMYPFAERPDVSVRVLWFPVPLDRPNVIPPTPFVKRTWDRLDQLPQTIPGMDQEFVEYYFGPLPLNNPGTPCGTPEQWNGVIDYQTWLEGGYTCGCPAMILPVYVSSVNCPDGSLIVTPTTGDVLVSINTSHENIWLAEQIFRAAVIVQSNLFEVNNAVPPPTHNLVQIDLKGDDVGGFGEITAEVTPVGGSGFLNVIALQPSLTSGTSSFTFSSRVGLAGLDTQLIMIDSFGTAHAGTTGTLADGSEVYGGLLTAIGGPAAAVILDQFVDTNGTLLAAHTIAPINTPSATWAVSAAGVLQIDSNAVHATSGTPIGFCNAGLADVNCSLVFRQTVSDSWAGVIVRKDAGSNYVVANATPTALQIATHATHGGSTLANVVYSFASNASITLRLKAKGVQLTATLESPDGVVLAAAYAESTFAQTNQNVGFILTNPTSDGVTVDDFTVRPS